RDVGTPVRAVTSTCSTAATWFTDVPGNWRMPSAMPFMPSDLSALELAVTGGAPCPLPVLESFQGKGVPLYEGFGTTETAPSVTLLGAERVKEKNGSIGRALFHVETRIVDD